MKKKKKVSEIIWEGLQNIVVIIIFVALFTLKYALRRSTS